MGTVEQLDKGLINERLSGEYHTLTPLIRGQYLPAT